MESSSLQEWGVSVSALLHFEEKEAYPTFVLYIALSSTSISTKQFAGKHLHFVEYTSITLWILPNKIWPNPSVRAWKRLCKFIFPASNQARAIEDTYH